MWQISVCCAWPRIRLFWLNAASSATALKEVERVMPRIVSCWQTKQLKQLSNIATDLACIAHQPRISCNLPEKGLAWRCPRFVENNSYVKDGRVPCRAW